MIKTQLVYKTQRIFVFVALRLEFIVRWIVSPPRFISDLKIFNAKRGRLGIEIMLIGDRRNAIDLPASVFQLQEELRILGI